MDSILGYKLNADVASVAGHRLSLILGQSIWNTFPGQVRRNVCTMPEFVLILRGEDSLLGLAGICIESEELVSSLIHFLLGNPRDACRLLRMLWYGDPSCLMV